MRKFTFPIQFAGIYSTFRSFQSLLTTEDQECCLRCIYRHLRSDGLLVLNLFDPRYELLLPAECAATAPSRSLIHPTSGNRVTVEVLQRVNDVLHQCLTEIWRFTEFGPDDTTVLRQEEEAQAALDLSSGDASPLAHLRISSGCRVFGFRNVASGLRSRTGLGRRKTGLT
jgi:hypothetical protein